MGQSRDIIKDIAIALTTGRDAGIDMNTKTAVMATIHDQCAPRKPFGNLIQNQPRNQLTFVLIRNTIDAALITQPVICKQVLTKWMTEVKKELVLKHSRRDNNG